LRTVIGQKFRLLWTYYFLQSFLATLALLIIALILDTDKIVTISSMGATSFIVFAMPTAVSAQTRNVIGGHLVGLACGVIFSLVSLPHPVVYALTVGMAIFLMVALDVEHPPAAGTALAVVIREVSFEVFVTVMISAIILSQCRYFLRHKLKDLI
jgi:CBS-domain-containing membrane protein